MEKSLPEYKANEVKYGKHDLFYEPKLQRMSGSAQPSAGGR